MNDPLININDIFTITGLSAEELTSLIPYAEAQAEAEIGYLHAESKTQQFYVYDTSDLFKLDIFPVTSVDSISRKASASTDSEDYDTDEYRTIVNEGLIIFDSPVLENYTLDVDFTIGWTTSTVTDLVKLYLSVLTVNQYYSLNPELSISSKVITQEKIGDYAVKYSGLSKMSFKSLDEWSSYLAVLIRKGGSSPEVHSV